MSWQTRPQSAYDRLYIVTDDSPLGLVFGQVGKTEGLGRLYRSMAVVKRFEPTVAD